MKKEFQQQQWITIGIVSLKGTGEKWRFWAISEEGNKFIENFKEKHRRISISLTTNPSYDRKGMPWHNLIVRSWVGLQEVFYTCPATLLSNLL